MPADSKNTKKKFWKRRLSVDSIFSTLNHGCSNNRMPNSHSNQSSFREDESDTNSNGVENGDVISPKSIEESDSAFNPGAKIVSLVKLNDALIEEVADLKSDKTKWMHKVKDLESKVYNNLIKIDEWLDASKGLRHDMETLEHSSMRPESFEKGNCKSLTRINSLEQQKNDLEVSLSESKRQLWQACQRAEWIEAAAVDANDKVEGLKEELEKLRNESRIPCNKTIMSEAEKKKQETTFRDLEVQKKEQDLELRKLKTQKVTLQQDLQGLNEAFSEMKQRNDGLREMLANLGSQKENLEVKIEELTAEQRKLCLELEHERVCQEALAEDVKDLQIQKEELEQELLAEQERTHFELKQGAARHETLREEIRTLQFQKEELSLEKRRLCLDSEKERTCQKTLREEITVLQHQNAELSAEKARIQLELGQERSCLETLRKEITSLQIQKEEIKQEATSRKCLTQQDAARLSRLEIEETNVRQISSSLEEGGYTMAVKKVIASFREPSNMSEELQTTEYKMQSLENELRKAKEIVKRSVCKVSGLVTEIDLFRRAWDRKLRIANVVFPAAATSVSVSALVTLAFLTLFRVKKRKCELSMNTKHNALSIDYKIKRILFNFF